MRDTIEVFDTLDQAFLARHSAILARSYRHWTGKPLLDDADSDAGLAQRLFEAPFSLLSHGTEADPLFNYGNQQALLLFGMTWQDLIGLPSRYSAETMLREERERLLERVARHGYVDDYSGVRIAKDGRRFMIRNAIVWKLLDETGQCYGQAALIKQHIPL